MRRKPIYYDLESPGSDLIRRERERQLMEEGYTHAHDDRHSSQEIPRAAQCYLEMVIARGWLSPERYRKEESPFEWPWGKKSWKPKNKISDLVKAGALIAAEIDRLKRIENKKVRK